MAKKCPECDYGTDSGLNAYCPKCRTKLEEVESLDRIEESDSGEEVETPEDNQGIEGEAYECTHSDCGRSFSTKQGRSLHETQIHEVDDASD